jgi:superfamily II DNA or RNA helicase
MSNPAPLQYKVLRAAPEPEDYELYRSALEWDLIDPIVIESRSDVKSASRWRDRVEPFNHQVNNLITFCRRLPVTLLADDVGLGKTISAGLIMSELIARSRLSKTLIVAPKILGAQWREELESKFDIPTQVVTGRDLLTADPEDVGAVITTYHSAREYLDRLPPDRFQMLVLDEAHKLRNLYGTEKAPQVAVRFRKALEQRRFPFVLMLTATPIQNRLWDLYSLVDLLTVARGHKNPFGSDGQFARKFIDGDRDQARRLKPESIQEFRSIVYGYMSRVRRGDVKLHFPDRNVQLHRVDPTEKELDLIKVVGKGIESLNKLAQISILQALTSSPQALKAQLDNMERNRTIAPEFAASVRAIVQTMQTSAKLEGLGGLINNLMKQNPERWRLVVFTSRRETQTTIQIFLESLGLSVGIINGTSGSRNQDTIASFRANPPRYRIIVSTEAGSEGVNLQVANVLVNYDLPWNPMIVEQRIGRIQRLASEHASVGIFNITLRGTFEEYIVGRLMQKLQMATSAIGDIEALLEGSGVGGDDEEGFEEKIRQLVIAALKGSDTEAATRMFEQSIAEAKQSLEREESRINELLGATEGQGYVGPRAPTLPLPQRSMSAQEFTLRAYESLGAKITARPGHQYLVEEESGSEIIRFDDLADMDVRSTSYASGSAAFSKLVQRIANSGLHAVKDLDNEPDRVADKIAREWVRDFGGEVEKVEIEEARRRFEGTALVRARVTVAHDSYERLVEVDCNPPRDGIFARNALSSLPRNLEHPAALGFDPAQIVEGAAQDPAFSEFSRFYLERRAQEMQAAGTDERKRTKMEDDFTPRHSFELAGLKGELSREVRARIWYRLEGGANLESEITVLPSVHRITSLPPFGVCAITKKSVPTVGLSRCSISGEHALTHLLVRSEHTGRLAKPEHAAICEQSGKNLLSDEVELSGITNRLFAKHLLKTSGVSGIRAEAQEFEKCSFTGIEALRNELRVSELSNRRFRADECATSSVSSKIGHRSEFVPCFETQQLIATNEAETCAVTGQKVRPGVLQECEETGSHALPSEIASSAVSGKRTLRKLLVRSSVSQAPLLEREAVRSSSGSYCTPIEATNCLWSGEISHPEDIRKCELTGLEIHFKYVTAKETFLVPLKRLLDGTARDDDAKESWEQIEQREAQAIGKGRCRVEAALRSPNGKYLAVSSEVKTFLGFRKRHMGFLFANEKQSIVGMIAEGTREGWGWRRIKMD